MHNQIKSVDPSVYTHKYYLSDCAGFAEFKKSYGEQLELRFKELVKYFKITKDMRVLDIGCGRGEMVLYTAKQGAKATGIDYSKEAIAIANSMRMKKKESLRSRMKFYLMDSKHLAFDESSFDMVIMTDVIEHLYDHELDSVFKEIKRVLKKDGILIIHTAPNKIFIDYAYKYSYVVSKAIVHIWNMLTKSKYSNIENPKNLRTKSHAVMHVNEPTYFSLKRLFNKYNFLGLLVSSNITSKKPELSIKDMLFNFFVFLHPFSRNFPLNIFFGSDFIAVLKNKK